MASGRARPRRLHSVDGVADKLFKRADSGETSPGVSACHLRHGLVENGTYELVVAGEVTFEGWGEALWVGCPTCLAYVFGVHSPKESAQVFDHVPLSSQRSQVSRPKLHEEL